MLPSAEESVWASSSATGVIREKTLSHTCARWTPWKDWKAAAQSTCSCSRRQSPMKFRKRYRTHEWTMPSFWWTRKPVSSAPVIGRQITLWILEVSVLCKTISRRTHNRFVVRLSRSLIETGTRTTAFRSVNLSTNVINCYPKRFLVACEKVLFRKRCQINWI